MNENKSWETYEEVAAYLLNEFASEFGLERFEGKQIVDGNRSKTKWEIDAKGIGKNNELFFIVECRRYTTSRQNQERLGGLAYRILDTGAEGGFLVSPLGFQEGATLVAQAENIYEVTLDQNSTCTEYLMKFLEKLRAGKELKTNITVTASVTAKVIRANGEVEDLGKL